MTILFDASHFAKPARTFGKGLLRFNANYTGQVGYSDADSAWLAEQNANVAVSDPGPMSQAEALWLESRAMAAGELGE